MRPEQRDLMLELEAQIKKYRARLAVIEDVYEKYKRFDAEWALSLRGYSPAFLRGALVDCWQAIKTAREGGKSG